MLINLMMKFMTLETMNQQICRHLSESSILLLMCFITHFMISA